MDLLSTRLNYEAQSSLQKKRTSEIIRHWAFSAISTELRAHYGQNYSDRCLQSSLGIQILLAGLGISSKLILGSVCLPIIGTTQPMEIGWQGFWDKHHHVWLMTEFYELVDLTITQINQHPAFNTPNRFNPPAIWWDDTVNIPSFIKYLPTQPLVKYELPDSEARDIEAFANRVRLIKTDSYIDEMSSPYFGRIMTGTSSLDCWLESGDGWTEGCLTILKAEISLPQWILDKERQLLEMVATEKDK